jgi:Fic family protein
MKNPIGTLVLQAEGFKAFIPNKFPQKALFQISPALIKKANTATLKLGKLDGITKLLPDLDFFLFMYIRKDAASSSQIEGTRATMINAIEAESKISDTIPKDVDDILHYIDALNYGMKRLKDLPISNRFICEVHKELMQNARTSHYSDPGNFRISQNWIGGTTPANAKFVPPPVPAMKDALSDLEKFFHSDDVFLPIIKAGLIHAQFETIHPFLDGNGRTGRILITLFLWIEELLKKPVLFLSDYFKKHQQIYYDKLREYHNGNFESWLDFFLDGVIEVANESFITINKITDIRVVDMQKIQSLNKTASKSSILILQKLFTLPIVTVPKIMEWTGFTRQGAQKAIDRLVSLEILELKDVNEKYGRSFVYKRYLDIFENS